ncbi:MAG TPA: hypothetical protein PLE68_01050 [Bacillota bacterium]|nr:hypothetical protein [Bacillota bacterium]
MLNYYFSPLSSRLGICTAWHPLQLAQEGQATVPQRGHLPGTVSKG